MKKQVCNKCAYFNAYYNQKCSRYEKLSYGLCSVDNIQHNQNENCDNFKNNEKREERRINILYSNLLSTLESINEMAEIIKEKENREG